jgi:hypothetical protein
MLNRGLCSESPSRVAPLQDLLTETVRWAGGAAGHRIVARLDGGGRRDRQKIKEVDSMKRGLMAFAAAGMLAVSMAGGASAAAKSENCIATASSGVQHNGTHAGGTLGEGNNVDRGENSGPNHGARGAEIKGLQDSCNDANGK